MPTMFNSEGHLYTTVGYLPGIVAPAGSEMASIYRNDDHVFQWWIGIQPNPQRISNYNPEPGIVERNAIEYQVITNNGVNVNIKIGPGFLGEYNEGLNAAQLSSQAAREYIEQKYGAWGIKRLDTCLMMQKTHALLPSTRSET